MIVKSLPKFTSIHVPKAAGVSFYYALREIYGRALLHDNAMSPLNPLSGVPNYPRGWSKYNVIHGHFDYTKYSHLPLITWVRDPVDRIISHYCYWRYKRKLSKGDFYNDILRTRNLDIYQFAELLPNTATILTGEYVERYMFVGIIEHFDTCLEYFNNLTGLEVKGGVKKNVNNKKPEVLSRDNIDVERLTIFLRKDLKFYKQALSLYNF